MFNTTLSLDSFYQIIYPMQTVMGKVIRQRKAIKVVIGKGQTAHSFSQEPVHNQK